VKTLSNIISFGLTLINKLIVLVCLNSLYGILNEYFGT